MAEFTNPAAITKDASPRAEAARFRADYPHKVWSHQIAGGENVVALIFAADRPVTAEEAKQLATLVQNQRPELVKSGAMLAATLPGAEEFPAERDVFLKATFELLAASQPPAE
ncbi:MAG: hypothetical protein ACYS7Y_35985 [Planctomycetota bacterium]|jgi:hypothetical protein